VLDAAYWVKGCSSLGRLRFAVLLGVGKRFDENGALCLMDIKEAVPATAPCCANANMPEDHAVRVVTGARHLSPALGERMIADPEGQQQRYRSWQNIGGSQFAGGQAKRKVATSVLLSRFD
jgi:uncharacterized protein (DUF2252 family)